jgi:dihydroxyacetone kinase-like predicted kinase
LRAWQANTRKPRAEAGATYQDVLAAAVEGANIAVAETPNQLKQLRDAGVVDAGGKGLAIMLEGMLKHARGEEIIRAEGTKTVSVAFNIDEIHSEDDFGYCTTLLLEGTQIPFDEVRETIAAMGSVGGGGWRRNVGQGAYHTLRPGDVLNYAMN